MYKASDPRTAGIAADLAGRWSAAQESREGGRPSLTVPSVHVVRRLLPLGGDHGEVPVQLHLDLHSGVEAHLDLVGALLVTDLVVTDRALADMGECGFLRLLASGARDRGVAALVRGRDGRAGADEGEDDRRAGDDHYACGGTEHRALPGSLWGRDRR